MGFENRIPYIKNAKEVTLSWQEIFKNWEKALEVSRKISSLELCLPRISSESGYDVSPTLRKKQGVEENPQESYRFSGIATFGDYFNIKIKRRKVTVTVKDKSNYPKIVRSGYRDEKTGKYISENIAEEVSGDRKLFLLLAADEIKNFIKEIIKTGQIPDIENDSRFNRLKILFGVDLVKFKTDNEHQYKGVELEIPRFTIPKGLM